MPYQGSERNDTINTRYEEMLQRPDFWKRLAAAHINATMQELYIMEPSNATDKTEEQVDEDWERFNSQTKPFRRKADWITLQYLEMTNQELYEAMKSRFMVSYSRFAVVSDGDVGYSGGPINLYENELEYTPPSEELQPLDSMLDTIPDLNLKMQDASDYFDQTGYIMIIPNKIANEVDLDKAWDGYNQMIRRHQRMADWKTVECFGLTNQQLYRAMKTKFQNNDDMDGLIESTSSREVDFTYKNLNHLLENYISKGIQNHDFTNRELAEALTNINSQEDVFYKMSGQKIIDKAIDQHDGLSVNVPSAMFDYTDLPMYSPDEMIDMGVTAHGDPESGSDGPGTDVIPSIKWDSKGWFTEYSKLWNFGVATDEFYHHNLQRVHRLEALYIVPHPGNANWEYCVRECGWDPLIPFNPQNRVATDYGTNQRLGEACNVYDFVDVSDQPSLKEASVKLAIDDIVDPIIKDINTIGDDRFEGSPLRPIYIVMVGGQAAFSKLIKTVTQSKYSHATLSLDPSMKRCYSYGTDPAVSLKGGFIVEDLITRPHDTYMRIYTVFVSNEVYQTIKRNIEWFIQHQKDTRYSWSNLITYLFKMPMEKETNMICSQFVDRMLKLGRVDFTKTKSSLIAPKDMDNFASRSKRVYTVYKGEIGKYKPEKIFNQVKSLMTRAKAFTGALESTSFGRVGNVMLTDKDAVTTFYNEYCGMMDSAQKQIFDRLILPCCEAKEIPIKIDTNGDIFVQNLLMNNFDAEYAKSHKLLKEYEKDKNIDGMKTELCKLWSILIKIEEKLYGPHSMKPEKRRALYNTRAHIIQDFKKYLRIVQTAECGFDFAKYYDESPYSNNSYKISGSTVNGVMRLAKELVK